MKIVFSLILFFFVTSAFSQVTTSLGEENLPLMEGGMGAIGLQVPHYPGSNYTRNFVIPFPAFIYRGKVLRADEDGGLRSRYLLRESLEVNLSIGGSLPANSKDNPDRQGMPDLDTMFEFGPGLIIHLIRPSSRLPVKMGINIPLRVSLASDFKSIDERGLVFNPIFYYIHEGIPTRKITLFTSFGFRFASRKNQDTFYTVDPSYQTAQRPSYRADGGYMGTNLALSFGYKASSKLTIFAGANNSFYNNAVNLNSPLFKKKYTTSFALGFIWWFYQSEKIGIKN